MKQKMKFKDVLAITAACIVALLLGMLMAVPTILKIELTTSTIKYLDRH